MTSQPASTRDSEGPVKERVELPGAHGLTLVADVGGPGDGPTVVLLPGGGQTRHSWSGTWKVLAAAGWRVWSVDMRGHGESDWAPDGNYTIDAFASDVSSLARSLPSPPVLVGASLGGIASLVAVGEAEEQQAIATAIVLVDVAHRLEAVGAERIGAFMTGNLDGFASLEEAADVISAYNPHRPRPKDLSGLAKNLRQRDDGRWVWHWDPRFVNGRFGSPDETRSVSAGRPRLDRAVEALRVPTLLVRGRSSDLLSQEGVDDFISRAPHTEFADVSGAGHMVVGDRNEVFNQAIVTFLERHRP